MIIPCPACHAQLSQNAPTCPRCGEPIKTSVSDTSRTLRYGWAILWTIPFLLALVKCGEIIAELITPNDYSPGPADLAFLVVLTVALWAIG